MNVDPCRRKKRDEGRRREDEPPFLWGFLLNFVKQYPGGGGGGGREHGLAGAETLDIRIIIIIQLKGYSPTVSLKGGDEQFQAYSNV